MLLRGKSLLVILLLTISFGVYSQQTHTTIIYFDFNKAEMTNESSWKIDSLLDMNSHMPITKVEVKGHCDKIGSNSYNDRLALKRVATTRQYLLNMGVHDSLISSLMAYGERRPVNKNIDEFERSLNRRVEIVIYRTFNRPNPVKNSLSKQISDTSLKVGSTLTLKNLNFHPGRHFLINESMPSLDELLQVLKDNPKLRIEIHGHVCCTSEPDALDVDLNIANLSIQRARIIYHYLIDNGIAASRLSYKGFGSSRKLYPGEKNDFERQENRRVEIKIIGK